MIDSHQHFWKYDAREYDWIDARMAALKRDFLPDELRREMSAVNFDGCIAVQARQTLEETRFLLDLADRHPFVLGVVGWVDLQSLTVGEQIRRFAGHPKLVGMRHIVQGEPDDRFLLREDFGRGLAELERAGLAYDILIYPRHLEVAKEFVRRFPRMRFVLDHAAKPDVRGGEIEKWERGIRALAEAPHVHCKLSGLVTEADWERWTEAQLRPYLDVLFDSFGAERLMIGSDWPVSILASRYARTIGVVMEYLAQKSDAERRAVLGGNAQRFWNLTSGEVEGTR